MTEKSRFPRWTNAVDAEKITASRYSTGTPCSGYSSAKRYNIIILAPLAIIILFAYIYPAIIHYNPEIDPYIHVLEPSNFHLTPTEGNEPLRVPRSSGCWAAVLPANPPDAVWYGAGISTSLAFVCALINMTMGVVIGAIWGFSKKFDMIMNPIYNIVAYVPHILLISVFIMIMSASFLGRWYLLLRSRAG